MIVQLFGSHPSASAAPLIPTASRWMVGTAYTRIPDQPFHVVFDLHWNDDIDLRKETIWEEYACLAATGVQLVLLEPHASIPDARIYPLRAVRKYFAHDGQLESSFQSSLDYMLALAIMDGATWIDVQGVDMRAVDEYMAQRETFRYWMGIARGRGIRVTVPAPSGLDGAYALYGYLTPTGEPGPPGEMVCIDDLSAFLAVRS